MLSELLKKRKKKIALKIRSRFFLLNEMITYLFEATLFSQNTISTLTWDEPHQAT